MAENERTGHDLLDKTQSRILDAARDKIKTINNTIYNMSAQNMTCDELIKKYKKALQSMETPELKVIFKNMVKGAAEPSDENFPVEITAFEPLKNIFKSEETRAEVNKELDKATTDNADNIVSDFNNKFRAILTPKQVEAYDAKFLPLPTPLEGGGNPIDADEMTKRINEFFEKQTRFQVNDKNHLILNRADLCTYIAFNLAFKAMITFVLAQAIEKNCLKRLASYLDYRICVPPNIEKIMNNLDMNNLDKKNAVIVALRPYLKPKGNCENDCTSAKGIMATLEPNDKQKYMSDVKELYNTQKKLLRKSTGIMKKLYSADIINTAELNNLGTVAMSSIKEMEKTFDDTYNSLIDSILKSKITL